MSSSVGGISSFEASISLRELVLRRLQADPAVQAQTAPPPPPRPPAEPVERDGCSVDVYA